MLIISIVNDNRFCVYLHRRKDNNEVFYVGHGTSRRPNASCKYTRSKQWFKVVEEAGGRIVEVLYSDLSKSEAVKIETELIDSLSGLINSKNNAPRVYPPASYFSGFVAYSPDSPSGLKWAVRTRKKSEGETAGHAHWVNGKGYWKVIIEGRPYRVSRIICILAGLYLDKELVVDHIDGDSLNNKLDNLRICTQSDNMEFVNTTRSECPGVKFRKSEQRWIAQWQENHKQKEKGFPVRKYGHEEAKRLAVEYRKLMVSLKES